MSDFSLVSSLNPAQKQAVTHGNGPLLIVAGAGTGKTTVITQRLSWLIDQKLAKPNEILTLTFTEKASEELEERIDIILPYGYLDLWVHTFHAFCERILKTHGLDIGLSNDFKLLTPTEAWLLVRENLDKFSLDYYRPLGNPTKFIHALLKHFSRCKDEIISQQEYLNYAENLTLDSDAAFSSQDIFLDTKKSLAEVANAYHTYNQILLDNNALDFGDLINYAVKLFKERPRILEFYRQKFKYILVDEFQDTNLAQYELIKMLAAPKNNLTVVGDDDQAIYKFRGASVSNILHFKNDFSKAELVTLVENYRSKQNILDKAYTLIKNNNPDRLEEKLKIDKRLIAKNAGEGEIEEIFGRSGEEEAKLVAEKIAAIKNESEKKGNAIFWNDFAILIRSNAESEYFMSALERIGVPYQFLASTGLFRENLILDIIAYLKLLDNYHENSALFRILNMKLWGVETSEIIKITHHAKKKTWSIFETLKQSRAIGVSEENAQKIDKFLALVEKHTQIGRTAPVSGVIYAFLNESGYLKELVSKNDKREAEAAKQIMFLKQFYDTILKFEQSHADKLIKNYLDYYNYVLESGEEGALEKNFDTGPESVKILTIHGAKGLEFKYVFIVNLVEQKFPSVSRSDAIELPEKLVKEILPEGDVHIQEERRLFYVAITRAKEGLYFSRALNYGGVKKRKPSRFLLEIGLGKIAKQNEEFLKEIIIPKKEMALTVGHEIPSHFSFTQLKAFEICPYQYSLAHILKIPTKGNASFSFGRSLHLTMQKFYERIINLNSSIQVSLFNQSKSKIKNKIIAPPMEDLLDIYEESWVDEWFQSKEQKESYFTKGKKIIREYYEKQDWTIPKFLEAGFHLKIGDYKIKGQIDRIDILPDGSAELIDYKSGRPKKLEDLKWEDKEQLFIYQLASLRSLSEKPSLLSFYYLDNNTKVSFLGKEKDLVKLEEKIIKNIESIKQSDFLPNPSIFNCGHCDFKEICEYAKL